MQRRDFLKSGAMAAAVTVSGVRFVSAAEYKGALMPGSLDAVRLTGEHFSIPAGDLTDLDKAVYGRVLVPTSDGYDTARHIRNPAIDKHPAVIVQVRGVTDIQLAVNFAREHKLLTAVRCGGHSFSGQSVCDGGMMIDMATMPGVRIDPENKRAWVTGGSLLGLLDRESMAHNLVTTMGTVSHTGVGGLVTGGGLGRLSRRFGMAIDNLVSVDMVTADGSFVHADATENPDLFWGVRGGGGNFGIVSMFEFQLHPMQRQVMSGIMAFPPEQSLDVFKMFADYSVHAPTMLDLSMSYSPRGATVTVFYSGDPKDLDRLLDPVRKAGKATVDRINAMDYVAVQNGGDVKETSTDPRMLMGQYMKARFLKGISPELIKGLQDGVAKHQLSVTLSTGCGMHGNVKSTDTAFAHRYATHNMLCGTSWRENEDGAAPMKNVRDFWAEIEPLLGDVGFYVNDAPAGEVLNNANYRENYPRLVQIKNKYDPGNLFRLNANIIPTAKA